MENVFQTPGTQASPVHTRLARILLCCAVTLGCSGPVALAAVAAEPTRAVSQVQMSTYSIPTAPLDEALTAYGIASGVQVIYPAEITQSLRSAPLNGRFSPEQALAAILAGTGLHYRFTDSRSVTLFREGHAPSRTVELDAVVVTGEKINRSLQQTQTSVVVATEADFLEHGDRTLNDVFARTPGVYTESGNQNWGIRGVPVSGFDDQGPATLNGAVSVFVDGAQLPNRALTLSPLPLWDVEQVEVLMGPQSTTQGRNSLAGAVVIQTKNPSFAPSLSMQTNAGSYGERGAAVAAGGRLVGDVVAGRLAVDYQEGDGYIDNIATGGDANPRRNSNLRGKLLILPDDDLDVLLSYAHNENKQGENAVIRENGRVRFYKISEDTDAYDKLMQDSFTAKVDYRLNDAWTLTSLSSATRADYNARLDFDQSADANWVVLRSQDTAMLSQEFRLGYDSEELRSFVGAYVGRATNDFHDRLLVSGGSFGTVLGDTTIDNQALFGEVNWTFQPRWTLTMGLRYDREQNDTAVDQDDFSSPGSASERFHAFLPKVGLAYEPTEDQFVGLMVQKGYRGGGVNVRAGGGHTAYDPEYTTNYELSYRGAWHERSLRARVNVYHTDWKDQQVSMLDSSGSFFQVYNAGESSIDGIEAFLEKDVSRELTLTAGLAYTDGRYKEFAPQGDDLSGEAFLYAPRYKASLGGVYRLASGLIVGTDVVYQEGTPSQYEFDGNGQVAHVRKSDHYTLVNLNASYVLVEGLTVSGYVKNLFDKQYVTNNRSDILDVGAPRTLMFTLRYDL